MLKLNDYSYLAIFQKIDIQIQHLLKLNCIEKGYKELEITIQIQHLLKLNLPLAVVNIVLRFIQIQHLLKLNCLSIVPIDFHSLNSNTTLVKVKLELKDTVKLMLSAFKYNTC